MKVRPAAEIHADFPDDMVEEDGEIVQFGGEGIASAVAEALTRAGYQPSVPQHAGLHGWDFVVTVGKREFCLQLSDLGEFYYLVTYDTALFDGWFGKKNRPEHAKLLRDLAGELPHDPRFRKVEWHFLEELDSGRPGAKDPIAN